MVSKVSSHASTYDTKSDWYSIINLASYRGFIRMSIRIMQKDRRDGAMNAAGHSILSFS